MHQTNISVVWMSVQGEQYQFQQHGNVYAHPCYFVDACKDMRDSEKFQTNVRLWWEIKIHLHYLIVMHRFRIKKCFYIFLEWHKDYDDFKFTF